MMKSSDPASFYTQWSQDIGLAFSVKGAMGKKKVVLLDPAAVAHFYSKETVIYRLNEMSKTAIANIVSSVGL